MKKTMGQEEVAFDLEIKNTLNLQEKKNGCFFFTFRYYDLTISDEH